MNLSETKFVASDNINYEQILNLKIRSLLMSEIESLIERNGWTQAEAGKRMHVNQPRISNLIRGKSEKFSVDMLIQMLTRAGQHVEVTVPRSTNQARVVNVQPESFFSSLGTY